MNHYKLKNAFTLVEILIVIIILGILAAIIIPQFSTASLEARQNMLRENLRILRTQILTYRAQHNDVSPGCDVDGNSSEDLFIAQITQATDQYGNAGNDFGPYMAKIPENTMNQLSTIAIVDELPAEAPDNDGWIYDPDEVLFRADAAGQDSSGRDYYNY